jgi:hypothetical protein
MEPFKLSKTNTTRLLLPMIVKENITFDKIIEKGFIDSYLIDGSNIEYMLINENIIIASTYFVDEHYNENLYNEIIELYIDESDNNVNYLFVHQIDNRWIKDYYNIISGNYKEISEEYIEYLLSFWKLNKESFLYYILTDNQDKLKSYFKKYNNRSTYIKNKNKNINNIIPFDIVNEGYKLFDNKEVVDPTTEPVMEEVDES